ncbi:MAG: hypothetical protein K0R29_1799 [Pseudobdellovibrio sp.]|jgi:hypothetical protein|nr:hypothetical protein [Pseudobdellovibrio sp.]
MKLITAFAFIFLSSCALNTKRADQPASSALSEPGVDPKYSVGKDRSEFDKLRENVPAEIRQQNDEKALIAELTAEVKYPPEVAREKFNNIVRKKRDLFSKDMSKIRDEFNRHEKKERDEFLEDLKEEREEFLKRKADQAKRSQFFSEQDEARRTFFADQREKRDEFESDFRARRKDFEDYIKDKTDIFNSELKDYTVRYKEKQEADRKSQSDSN